MMSEREVERLQESMYAGVVLGETGDAWRPQHSEG